MIILNNFEKVFNIKFITTKKEFKKIFYYGKKLCLSAFEMGQTKTYFKSRMT